MQENKVNNASNKLTHGLLIEDFKNQLSNILSNHELDIQSKAVVMELFFQHVQLLSRQQSEKELAEYKKFLDEEKAKESTEKNEKKGKVKEVSE